MNFQDAKYSALLQKLGISVGQVYDLEKAYLISELGTPVSDSINGLWTEFLIAQGITEGHIDDMFMAYMVAQGYTTGTLQDRLYAMWAAGGPTTTPPFDGVLRADFESGADLTTYGGSPTGTLNGGATVHDGLLDTTGNSVNRYVQWAGDGGNFFPTNLMTVNVIYRPNYSGTPAQHRYIWFWGRNADTRNNVWLNHETTSGIISWWMRNSAGTYIAAGVSFGAWSPTAGQDYELELNMDTNTGATRLFIDGTQMGATATNTGTLDDADPTARFIRLGAAANTGSHYADQSILDFKVWDTIQHTSDY